MTEFQALITGSIAGALMKAGSEEGHLLIDVDVPTDSKGNYLKEIHVTGRQSGEQLRITVEPMYDTPESVAEKLRIANMAVEAMNRSAGTGR